MEASRYRECRSRELIAIDPRSIALVLVFLFSSCTPAVRDPEPNTAPKPVNVESTESTQNTPQVPFTLSVMNESNDGRDLHVSAALLSRANWPLDNLQIRLSTLREGGVAEQKTWAIRDILDPTIAAELGKDLPANREVYLTASASALNATDYHLELLWGAEKVEVTPVSNVPVVLRNVEILKRLLCDTTPCDVAFQIEGEVVNQGTSAIHKVILGVGFVWVPLGGALDLSKQISENEEPLLVEGLTLEPGASKKIRLTLDQRVPERADGAYRPMVRVLSFE